MADQDLSIPRCKFCGGRGKPGEKIERVKDAFGHVYRIPVSHKDCKKSVNSLSLSLSLLTKRSEAQ